MFANSQHSSSESNYFTINSLFSVGANLETRALHNLISAGMTTSPPYVKENGVSLKDILGVVR